MSTIGGQSAAVRFEILARQLKAEQCKYLKAAIELFNTNWVGAENL